MSNDVDTVVFRNSRTTFLGFFIRQVVITAHGFKSGTVTPFVTKKVWWYVLANARSLFGYKPIASDRWRTNRACFLIILNNTALPLSNRMDLYKGWFSLGALSVITLTSPKHGPLRLLQSQKKELFFINRECGAPFLQFSALHKKTHSMKQSLVMSK